MTAIEKSHFYLEIGQVIAGVIEALKELEDKHTKWLQDAKHSFEEDNKAGHFTVSIKDIEKIEGSFLDGDIYSTYFGLRQLNILLCHKGCFFDETRSEEEALKLILKEALGTFRDHSDKYIEEKLSEMTQENSRAFYKKLRIWSLLKKQGANATNEISTLICRESTQKPRSILLEISLSKEVFLQAKYQQENYLEILAEDERTAPNNLIASIEAAELDFNI